MNIDDMRDNMKNDEKKSICFFKKEREGVSFGPNSEN
jgi:hypothetical protein